MARKSKKTTHVIKPKTQNQKHLINAIKAKPMVIAVGPAGTGKSYLTAILAADMLKEGRVDRIVLTRPTVPTGKSIGFFPGSLEEKMEPWCKPILETLKQRLGTSYEHSMKSGKIEIVPFETIRGRSFERSFIILDEAQNTTPEEVKAFVTRAGEDSITVINGDVEQSDLKGGPNGLKTLIHLAGTHTKLKRYVQVVKFTSDDIVRSGMCQFWVEAFQDQDKIPKDISWLQPQD